MRNLFFRRKRHNDIEEDVILEEKQLTPEEQSGKAELELTNVGPYEIVAKIGTGGMGTVYKAIDRQRDVTVAVKVLNRAYDLDRKKRRRDYLGREIGFASPLEHECIIKMENQIIEQEDRDGHVRRCLIMEYIDGFNLRKFIMDRDLSVPQMIQLCIRLCRGIDFLHQSGIIHRDIKPENFLFSRDLSQVKIVDFGLSKFTAGWLERWRKERGGTAGYMSPEQIARKKLDARSDIFSFGVTMYELLTGRHPCSGKDRRTILKQICDSSYRFQAPSHSNPNIPPALDKIILKCMRRRPDHRYQEVTEMLMDLTRIGESRI